MVRFDTGEGVVLEEDSQDGEIIARVAALDIGKAELVCCVRVPHEGKPGRRLQEVATYSTMTGSLLAMSDHLRCLGVSRVVMEATSDYWKSCCPIPRPVSMTWAPISTTITSAPRTQET